VQIKSTRRIIGDGMPNLAPHCGKQTWIRRASNPFRWLSMAGLHGDQNGNWPPTTQNADIISYMIYNARVVIVFKKLSNFDTVIFGSLPILLHLFLLKYFFTWKIAADPMIYLISNQTALYQNILHIGFVSILVFNHSKNLHGTALIHECWGSKVDE
jgi:hypothetical protein